MVSDRRQEGFTLVIGLILLAAMTLLAVSLAQRGLLDTRLAHFAETGVQRFQQQDGQIDTQLARLDALMPAYLTQPCSENASVPEADTQLSVQRLCLDDGQAGLSSAVREQLERRYATSLAAPGNQALKHYRYFNLRAVPEDFDDAFDQGQGVYQGVVTLSTGGTQ
ncbi:pilus assembly PilX family protein [Kushneria sp. TE3]|uniref:pilus assembly PilX family protein n=1 Tax=Kushneria sp. TE3 TaxID=3449832 RepID=UPI003F688CCF